MNNLRIGAAMLLLISYSTWAQAPYMKVFNGGGTAQLNLNEMSSGNLMTGMVLGAGVSLRGPDGHIIHSQVFRLDTFLNMQAVKRYTDNDYYFVGGYRKDSCSASGTLTIPYNHPVIGRMDSLGSIQEAHHYVLNTERCGNSAQDLEVLSDGGVMVWGNRNNVMFILKADAGGEALWAKSFNSIGTFTFVKELPGGDLLAGFNIGTAGGSVARLDPNGNFLWCKSYFRPKGMVHDAVIESDGSSIITGYTDSTNTNMFIPLPGTFQPKLFMMKLDGNGEVQWCRGYDSAPHHWHTPSGPRIVSTLDGKYAMLATMGQPGYNWFYRPMLMKLDLNGDTMWTRTVGLNGYDYFAKELLAYSDGGFMYNGQIWGDLPQGLLNSAFLYKTDASGHLPCAEPLHPLEVMALFPVDSSFTLISSDGATTLPAFVNETTFDTATIYDGCTLTTGLQYASGRPRKHTVRPNPTPGRFTVEFQDPLMRDSYYSVYDVMGKLLFQRAAAHGKKTEEVDLTGYGKGTYVIRFTDKDGACYERVVVE